MVIQPMSNLATRSTVGFVFSIVVIGSAFAGPYVFSVLFGFFAIKGLQEFIRMVLPNLRKSLRRIALVWGGLFYLLLVGSILFHWPFQLLLVIPIIWVLLLTLEMIRVNADFIHEMAVLLFGLFYVVMPFALLLIFSNWEGNHFNPWLPFGLFGILWINDSGAYFFGRFMGKHKLHERVSPKKTWEGLVGGMLTAIILGFFVSDIIPSGLNRVDWVFISIIIAIFANIGDLVESQIKRIRGVKDSGKLLPGHGGVLDRFDGLLLALPVIVAYLIIQL